MQGLFANARNPSMDSMIGYAEAEFLLQVVICHCLTWFMLFIIHKSKTRNDLAKLILVITGYIVTHVQPGSQELKQYGM